MKTAIHWFRRDLRLTDNTALAAAARRAESVVPVYIQSVWSGSHHWTGSHRQEFLCGSLKSLDESLRAIGSHLVVRRGDAVEELLKLARETGAEAIYFNRDPDPFGRAVEERLAKEAPEWGIELHAEKDICIHERDEVLTGKGDSFRVFTPYAKAWLKLDKPSAGGRLRSLPFPKKLSAGHLPRLTDWKIESAGKIIEPGEGAARTRLTAFLKEPIGKYGKGRDFPAEDSTSRLSQDLRYGLLSIREVFERCRAKAAELPAGARPSAHTFINELIWREFYMQVLWHCPEALDQDFNPKYRRMRWIGDEKDFPRWRDGETGFPIVDAAMRQLRETGFMHNRARMIVAMFLTKDLQLHWRLGESWFMQQLTDGEIASNNGGWQWSAGTGADAAPYFRIQNPWTQTARFDPEGKYIHRWVPELRDVPAAKLARPPGASALAKGYPLPMVDHAEAREKTLAMFRTVR
jgi:deoxyribodipyrimidine photo-lyase